MFGSKFLVFCLPLLFLDGAHLNSDAFRRPQPGKPWVAPTFVINSTGVINKQKQSDLERYVSQLYPQKEISQSVPPTQQPQRPAGDGSVIRGFRCPQPNGYFKYTNRCDEYVRCKNYIPITLTCPTGLHFSPYLQWTEIPCDHPSRVQCPEPGDQTPRVTSTSTTTTTTTTPPPPPPTTISAKVVPPPRPDNQLQDFICPQQHGYFQYTDQCTEYVECKNYVPLMFVCPIGLHFNQFAQWTQYPCDHPSKVNCNYRQKSRYPLPTSSTTTTTTPAPRPTTPAPKVVPTPRPGNQATGFMCPHAHGYFKYTDQCSDYIECKNYVPLTFTCPGGLHFNPLVPWTQYPCDYPSNVNCNIERDTATIRPTFKTLPPPTSTTTTTTTTPPPPSPPTTEPAVIAPRPKTPHSNYLCPQQFGYFKYTNQCGDYIECKNYVPLMFTCPVGLHFNPLVSWTEYPCDHPSNVQCIEEPGKPSAKTPPTPRPSTAAPPTPTTSTTTTTEMPKAVTTPRPGSELVNFMCPQPHGYFQYTGQCGEYVECKDHVPLSYSCPSGLHFNSRVQWTEYPCDHPSRAQCVRGN